MKLYKEGHGAGGTTGSAMSDGEDDDGNYELDGDNETDDLLQWTQQLNFESYVSDWTSTACTREPACVFIHHRSRSQPILSFCNFSLNP